MQGSPPQYGQSHYAQPQYYAHPASPKHSALGILAFIAGLGSGVLMLCLIVVAGVMETRTPGGLDEDSPVSITIGLLLFAFAGLALLAIGIGIGSFFQRDRRHIFGILGVVFAGLTLLGTVGLLILGVAMG